MAAFEELGVMPELSKALEQMGWTLPTDIQAEAIPMILGGGDVLMASETGTGKTGAFCVPIVQVVYEQLLDSSKLKTLVKAPTKKETSDQWVLSVIDRAPDVVLSSDLLMAQSKSGNWQGVRSNKGVHRSRLHQELNCRVYFEVHFAEQGLARLGWSHSDASFDLGTDKSGWGYGGTAKKSNSRQFNDYGLTFGEKFDIIGCIMDLRTGEMSFTKNGRSMGVAFKLPLAQLETRELYPTICVKNAGCTVRFGPPREKNDYKPENCSWISQVDPRLVRNGSQQSNKTGESQSGPLAIILEPSRELAKQTYDCLQTFSAGLGIVNELLVGGGDSQKSMEPKVHIIVCTPGRLSEGITKNQFGLNNVHFLILDEADGLLQQGNHNIIRTLHSRLPKMFHSGRRLQSICCSATLHNFEVRKLADQLMYFPMWIDLKGEDSVPDTVHHVVLRIDPKNSNVFRQLGDLFKTDGVHYKDNVDQVVYSDSKPLTRKEELSEAVKLMKFYYTVKAIESLNMDQGIIFCRTKLDCDHLNEFMESMNEKSNTNRFSTVRLHSSLSQKERTDNLLSFKKKEVNFLICTDVAARGIDVRGIPYVIQVTLPDEKANYIHRIGRVGRAERMGLALSLVSTVPEKVWYHGCRKNECHDTRLVEKGGCCKWFDELDMLGEIEDHLKCVISEIGTNFKIQVDEYDGKVVYGSKKLENTKTYEGHVEQLKNIVSNLTDMESRAQLNYLKLYLT